MPKNKSSADINNRDIRIGSLEDVQGCVERGLELIKNADITFDNPSESRSSTVYNFGHRDLGDIGKVKLSRLGENTEIYYYPPTEPNANETKEFLLAHIYLRDLEEPLQALLLLYLKEKKIGIADLTSTEHFDLGHRTDTPKIDSAKYGLDDLDKVHAANRALDRWRQKIRHRRDNEFSLIRNAIVRQLKLERILSDEVDGRPGEILVKLKSIDLSTKPPGRKVDSWNISAWNIIVQGKGTKDAYKEAFAKWCEEKGISEGSSDRYDKKAFKMAMKRAEDRWGWNLVEKVTKTST